MKTTNELEKALSQKAKQEVEKIVDNFINELNNLQKTYDCNSTHIELKEYRRNYGEGRIGLMYIDNLKEVLNRGLFEAYMSKMLRKKSYDLIKKLELIS